MMRHATCPMRSSFPAIASLLVSLAFGSFSNAQEKAPAAPAPALPPVPTAKPAPRAAEPVATPAPDAAKPSDILAGRPDADADQNAALLGETYESKGNGISLRPLKDMTPIRRLGATDIIEFVNESKGWSLKVSKIMLPKPGSLTEWRDAHGNLKPGVLEYTTTRLKEEIPEAEFLRSEKATVGDGEVGMIALRYTRNLKSLLSQQAIVQRTDQLYYLFALTTPGATKGSTPEAAAATEKLPMEAFRQVIASVKLLDLAAIRQDQDNRLYRTRGLLVNITADKLRKTLVPKQWIRILKNGKDIGYTYVEEKMSAKGAQDGVEVRVRSRSLPNKDVQIDVGSILFTSVDLRHEDWSTVTEQANPQQRLANPEYKPAQLTEFGISDRRAVPGQGDVYSLRVLFESTKEAAQPVERDLPPFYLPQAISHLLPRLVPLNEPKGYMFMTYTPDNREVTSRYIDVLEQRKVEFNNKMFRAVPVEDRLGLEGMVTTHYLSQTGEWLGSETKETGFSVVPSDEATLLNLWKDANLTRPEAAGPEAAAAPAGEDAPADARKSRPANDSAKPAAPAPGRLGVPGRGK